MKKKSYLLLTLAVFTAFVICRSFNAVSAASETKSANTVLTAVPAINSAASANSPDSLDLPATDPIANDRLSTEANSFSRADQISEAINENPVNEGSSFAIFCPKLFGYSDQIGEMEVIPEVCQNVLTADDPIIIRGQTENYWRTLDPYSPTYLAQSNAGATAASTAPTLNTTNAAAAGSTAAAGTTAPATNSSIAPTISNTPYTPSVEKVMKFWNKLSFEYTYLTRKDDLAMHEFDLATRFAVPCQILPTSSTGQQPVFYIAPRFSLDLWNWGDSESRKNHLDESDSLFDTSVDFMLDAQYGDFGFDAKISLGIASSFKKINGDAFYIRGRAMGKLLITEDNKFTATAGIIYYDRNEFKLLPSGGVIWRPNPANIWRIVFPDPMLSRHFGKYNETDWWGYIRGEIGGGRWFMPVYDNNYANIDYNDYRVALGCSFTTRCNFTGSLEVGGAFRRKFYGYGEDLYKPGSTLFVKAGLQF